MESAAQGKVNEYLFVLRLFYIQYFFTVLYYIYRSVLVSNMFRLEGWMDKKVFNPGRKGSIRRRDC